MNDQQAWVELFKANRPRFDRGKAADIGLTIDETNEAYAAMKNTTTVKTRKPRVSKEPVLVPDEIKKVPYMPMYTIGTPKQDWTIGTSENAKANKGL